MGCQGKMKGRRATAQSDGLGEKKKKGKNKGK
jgi:hypothetical protein